MTWPMISAAPRRGDAWVMETVKTRPPSRCDALVVDDEPAIQSLFKRLLETRLGIRVATANDGMEGTCAFLLTGRR